MSKELDLVLFHHRLQSRYPLRNDSIGDYLNEFTDQMTSHLMQRIDVSDKHCDHYWTSNRGQMAYTLLWLSILIAVWLLDERLRHMTWYVHLPSLAPLTSPIDIAWAASTNIGIIHLPIPYCSSAPANDDSANMTSFTGGRVHLKSCTAMDVTPVCIVIHSDERIPSIEQITPLYNQGMSAEAQHVTMPFPSLTDSLLALKTRAGSNKLNSTMNLVCL